MYLKKRKYNDLIIPNIRKKYCISHYLKGDNDDSTNDESELESVSDKSKGHELEKIDCMSPSELDKYYSNYVYHLDNHIYFTCGVTVIAINKLSKLIHALNNEYSCIKANSDSFANMTPKPLYLHITSTGGDLLSGLRAVDMIKNSHIPIHTVVEGYAISAASLMYLAGAKKYMTENSYLLIHQLSSDQSGTYERLKDENENNNILMDKLYKFYISASKNKLTRKKIQEFLKRDLFWNYEICKSYNLVDELYKLKN
jgi:ATP-dependent protease ClpP protease subunit